MSQSLKEEKSRYILKLMCVYIYLHLKPPMALQNNFKEITSEMADCF